MKPNNIPSTIECWIIPFISLIVVCFVVFSFTGHGVGFYAHLEQVHLSAASLLEININVRKIVQSVGLVKKYVRRKKQLLEVKKENATIAIAALKYVPITR